MAFLIHAVALFVGYWLSSIVEWILHNWFMHATTKDLLPTPILKRIRKEHLLHHIETNYDMSQKTVDSCEFKEWNVKEVITWLSDISDGKFKHYANIFSENEICGYELVRITDQHLKIFGITRYFDKLDILLAIQYLIKGEDENTKKTPVEKYKGLYFEWWITIIICISFLFASIIVNFICLNVLPYGEVIIYGQIFAIYMTVVWNYIHPTQHLQPALSLGNGLDLVPRFAWIENSFIYNWLWANHVLHHLCVGRNAGNYNVTLPGADWLFGTYKTKCKGYILDIQNKKIWKYGDPFHHKNVLLNAKRKETGQIFLQSKVFWFWLCHFSFVVVPSSIFLFLCVFLN